MDALPEWPDGTVATLVTQGDGPHAIPVSLLLRAGPREIVAGIAVERIADHNRPTYAIRDGVQWDWTDEDERATPPPAPTCAGSASVSFATGPDPEGWLRR